MENGIMLWDAITQMREISAKGGEFSMVYMSYDPGRGTSQGTVLVERARLRPGTPSDQNKNADYMLNFLNLEKNLPRQMYQVCLMEFNGQRIILS